MVFRCGQRYSAEAIFREGVREGWEFRALADAETISNPTPYGSKDNLNIMIFSNEIIRREFNVF